MQSKYKDHLNGDFRFVKMDVFNLELDESSIDAAIDKGTLDALAVDSSDETVNKLHNMFDQIEKVLSTLGRYVCISLLQEHILVALLNWITKKSKCNFLTRIYRLRGEDDASKSFPVFLIVATKLKPKTGQDNCLFELVLNEDYDAKPLRTLKEDVVIDLIKEIHNYNLIQNHIKNNSLPLEEELCFELFDSSQNINEYKYKFIITEQFSRENKLKFAIFIVPINREKEYLFATKEGRKEVCSLSSVQRLVFVILNANYNGYPSDQDEMHKELSPRVMDFAPKAFYSKPNQKVPFLTVKDQERELVYQGSSEFSGDYGVYDVKTDENGKEVILRQLIFSSNKNLIQSEAKIKPIKKKKKLVKLVDHSYLACLHHGAIICGICLYNKHVFSASLEQNLDKKLQLTEQQEPVLRILLIGLGGGCFTSFLQHNLKDNMRIEFDVVEIDETMVDVAKKWFDLNEQLKGDRFKIRIIVEDGLVYLNDFKPDNHYNIIIFDIDNKSESQGLSCPPQEFLEQKTLDNVKRLLRSDCLSLFMLNLAARNKTIKSRMENRLKSCFNQTNKYRIQDEINSIFYCFNAPIQLDELIDKERNLSDRMQKFIQLFNSTVKKDDFEIASVVDVCDFVTYLC